MPILLLWVTFVRFWGGNHVVNNYCVNYRYLPHLRQWHSAARSVATNKCIWLLIAGIVMYTYSIKVWEHFFHIWSENSWNICSMKHKFLERPLPRNERSTGAKVARSECSMERKFSLCTFHSQEQKVQIPRKCSTPETILVRYYTGWPLVGKTWKCQGIWQLSGKCQGFYQKNQGNVREKMLLGKVA